MISPRPGGTLSEQVAADLRAAILSGRLKPGQPIPSERTLQQQYTLARETVRRAVAILRSEGLVVVSRGHGVLVKEQPELEEYSPAPGSTVIARVPTADERATHDIGEGVPVFQVVEPDGHSRILPADQWKLRCPG